MITVIESSSGGGRQTQGRQEEFDRLNCPPRRCAFEYWNLVDKRVAAVVRIDELAGYDSGLTIADEPDNFDGQFSKFRTHSSLFYSRPPIAPRTRPSR
jgi:hypothetical protein